MIWFIVGFIVAVIIIICILRDDFYDFSEKLTLSTITLFCSGIASFVLIGIASILASSCAEIEYSVVSDTKIIALKDNQNANGSFYIGSGYVDEDLYYYYAIETEFGYKTEKIRADNVYIKYTDGEAHIEKHEGAFANESLSFWIGACICDDRYIIYCPEGTITNEFDVDLE